jgi:hypothetical protein
LEYTRKRRDAIEHAGLLEEAGDDDEVGDDQALEYTSDDAVVRPEADTGQINAVAPDPLPVRRRGLAAEFGRPGAQDAITRPVDVSEPAASQPAARPPIRRPEVSPNPPVHDEAPRAPSDQPAPVPPRTETSTPGAPSTGRFPSVAASPASLEASPAPQQVPSAAPARQPDPDPPLPRVRGDSGVNLGSAFDEARRVQHPSRVNTEPSPPSREPSRSATDPGDDEAPLIDLRSGGHEPGGSQHSPSETDTNTDTDIDTGDDLDVDAITGETSLYRGRRRRA